MCDQERLKFFIPNGKNEIFKEIPFGSKNVPVFATVIMQLFRDAWILYSTGLNILLYLTTFLLLQSATVVLLLRTFCYHGLTADSNCTAKLGF